MRRSASCWDTGRINVTLQHYASSSSQGRLPAGYDSMLDRFANWSRRRTDRAPLRGEPLMRHPFPSRAPPPLADWPSTDRAVWLAAQGKGGPFKARWGFASTWSAATRANVERSYGGLPHLARTRGASWTRGEEVELTPAQRLTPAHTRCLQFKAFAVGRAPHTVAPACVRDIAYMIRAERPPHGHPWATRLGHALVNRAEIVAPKTVPGWLCQRN